MNNQTMKNASFALLVLLFIYSCNVNIQEVEPQPGVSIDLDSASQIFVPDSIAAEESVDDPQEGGVACGPSNARLTTELISKIEIPADLPTEYDLSEDMPPVRSQGSQGSCVAWATTYYLKSYQEKIQKGYEYLTYEQVMSPAFVYNQSKANPNCGSGSNIADALEVLKTQGVNHWKDFPYSDAQCSTIPSDSLVSIAGANKIKEYFMVGVPDSNTDENYTMTSLIKTLISQQNPIVISMDFSNLVFESQNEVYIANTYSQNPDESACGHAILIVGYNDGLNAFKIVNSWGSAWGNEGYAWVNYNFFLSGNEAGYQQGLTGAFIAYDADE